MGKWNSKMEPWPELCDLLWFISWERGYEKRMEKESKFQCLIDHLPGIIWFDYFSSILSRLLTDSLWEASMIRNYSKRLPGNTSSLMRHKILRMASHWDFNLSLSSKQRGGFYWRAPPFKIIWKSYGHSYTFLCHPNFLRYNWAVIAKSLEITLNRTKLKKKGKYPPKMNTFKSLKRLLNLFYWEDWKSRLNPSSLFLSSLSLFLVI